MTAACFVIPGKLAQVKVRDGELDHHALLGVFADFSQLGQGGFDGGTESFGTVLEDLGNEVLGKLFLFELSFDLPDGNKTVVFTPSGGRR